MIRSQQLPWLSQQIVLMEFDLIRAARRKRTVYGEKRPETEVPVPAMQTLNDRNSARRPMRAHD
jgi:hypothetical protein